MSLTLWCGGCGEFLRNPREVEAGRCFTCKRADHDAAVAAAAQAAREAYLAAEVHDKCTECAADLTDHRGKVEGICGKCLLDFIALHKRAASTYISDTEARTVRCPNCGADRGALCHDGSGSNRKPADSPHTGRKVAVLVARQRMRDAMAAS